MFRLTPRRSSLRIRTSLGGSSDFAEEPLDWPLAAHSPPAPAPAATPASAAACFRNRLRPEPLDSMFASRDPEFLILRFLLVKRLSQYNLIVSSKILHVSNAALLK